MFENRDTRRQVDMIDMQICELLARREQLTGADAVPDRRRLAAVRRISQKLGRGVAGAYGAMLRSLSSGNTESSEVIDITRELMSAHVYPGDPEPKLERVLNIADGKMCNLTQLSMSTHNGTHIDAPLHFIDGAGDVCTVAPELFFGECVVVAYDNVAMGIPQGCERLLVKGDKELTEEQTQAIVSAGVKLVGVEAQSVGSPEVHKLLLGNNIIPVEGLALDAADEGEYTLVCAPMKIAGAEGSPCRALLIKE